MLNSAQQNGKKKAKASFLNYVMKNKVSSGIMVLVGATLWQCLLRDVLIQLIKHL